MGLERGPLSLIVQVKGYLKETVAAPAWKTEITAVGIRDADVEPSILKRWH
jgi:hypothetical protein